jgi:tRNA nucleotidyltransferase/poly(A) polymerase
VTGIVDRALVELRAAAPDGVLVGGCVRDWLLERPIKDLDVAVPVAEERRREGSEPAAEHRLRSARIQEVGRSIANSLGGAFFWLKEGMGVARVVVSGASPLQIDVVPLEGSLEADLRRRDFTINAMAVPIADGFSAAATVIDPIDGRTDLANRRLRLASPDALMRDPLRCLRAFRFRATLGFTFAEGTEVSLRTAAPGLKGISGERIRDELFTLLETPLSTQVMGELLAHDLVAPWSPALAASARGVTAEQQEEVPALAGLSVARALDGWLSDRSPELAWSADLDRTLSERITTPRSRLALLRLAALASLSGSETQELARTLALSAQEGRVLRRAVAGSRALAEAWPLPGRGRLRFWQEWEPGAVEAALLALSEARCLDDSKAALTSGSRGPRSEAEPTTVLEALLADLLERRLRPVPPLLAGSEVMTILSLPPGPVVGWYLQRVEERRADGLLSTAEEAWEWLREQRQTGQDSREQ